MNKISVVINTLNEEKNLPRALSSVSDFADEIVVVDMKSEDKTREIAKRFGANIYDHEKTNYVEPARNFAISKAKYDWIFILDADEEILVPLKNELKKIVDNPKADYFRIPRKNIIFGKWIKHSRWWPDYNIRFFKKGSVVWSEIIHSVPTTKGKGSDLEINEDLAIVHHNYESVDQYVNRMNRYTSEHSKNLVKNDYKFKWTDLIQKPVNEFLSRYFQGEGYKDGLHGLALASLQGISEFVMYLKTWQLGKFPEQRTDVNDVLDQINMSQSDYNFWKNDTLLKTYGGLKYRLKRKFKLP